MKDRALGIFGGTFDPIHRGHCQIAQAVLETLHLHKIYFVPCQTPVHKNTAVASPTHRLAMLHCALDDNPDIVIDTRELDRETPSYSVTTVASFRDEFFKTPLCFILGSDSFNQFTTWHEWERLLDLCHLIVYCRPGHAISAEQCHRELYRRMTNDKQVFQQQRAGSIYILRMQALDISASAIREKLAQGMLNHPDLSPSVMEYIKENQLYR